MSTPLPAVVGLGPPVLGCRLQPPPSLLPVTSPQIPAGRRQTHGLEGYRRRQRGIGVDHEQTSVEKVSWQFRSHPVSPDEVTVVPQREGSRLHPIEQQHPVLDVVTGTEALDRSGEIVDEKL
jgi:hypothetical protein